MTDFNNFFEDNDGGGDYNYTPVYHTPEPKHKHTKANLPLIISITAAVIMCVVVIVNVIVLASLKTKIAEEYSASIAAQMYDQYKQAINDELSEKNIKDDIIDSAANKATENLSAGVGKIAAQKAASVARLYMYKSTSTVNSQDVGVASAFLITDYDGTTGRYLVTNAHCVRYYSSSSMTRPLQSGWATYALIRANFDDENTSYDLEVVAYGGYSESSSIPAENNLPDLAVLKVKGTNQPDNDKHPSLKLATNDDDINRGSAVALIGNPEGLGNGNSISTGCVSQKGITIKSWGAGTFIMTDAAINGGNSGGPMINEAGVVIGVVESKLVDESIDNMGFALSAETLYDFLNNVKATNKIAINFKTA